MEMSVAPRFHTHQGQPAQPQALRLPGLSMPPFRCGLPSQAVVSVQRRGFLLPIFWEGCALGDCLLSKG